MTSRSIITVGFVALCGAALWGILAQGRHVSELQAEQKLLESGGPPPTAPPAETHATPIPAPEVPRELLQLRAEVAGLSQQQRELSAARQENERLRLQLEDRRTNRAAQKRADAAFIRASEAKWLGYNTPEDTLQSMFWAAQNHNLEKFLEAITPEIAEEFKSRFKDSDNPEEAAKKLFDDEGRIPAGFRIIGREQAADGAVALIIQVAHHTGAVVRPNSGLEPGLAVDSSEAIRFERIAGQWKMGKPH
jgi:hypothetical protein